MNPFFILFLLVVASICAAFVNSIKDRWMQVAGALLSLALLGALAISFVRFQRSEREPARDAIEYPAAGSFAKDRKTGQIDGSVIASGNGLVRVQFNEGYAPTFKVAAAWDRWEFVSERGAAENSPLALGALRDPSRPADPLPGQKLFTPDQNRYGGKILETDAARGCYVEFFNGKKEWVQVPELLAKWAVR